MNTDPAGNPTDISFILLTRGNGEFSKVGEAAQNGSFEGMPMANYSFTTGEVSVPREFYENCGFEVLTSFLRHGYKTLREFNSGREGIAKVASNFNDLLYLDDFDMDDEPSAPTI